MNNLTIKIKVFKATVKVKEIKLSNYMNNITIVFIAKNTQNISTWWYFNEIYKYIINE